MENKKNVITNRLKAQYDTLMKFHSTKANLEMIRKKFEASINQRKQEYNEITTKTSNEMEKSTILLFSIVLLTNFFNFTIIIIHIFYTFKFQF